MQVPRDAACGGGLEDLGGGPDTKRPLEEGGGLTAAEVELL